MEHSVKIEHVSKRFGSKAILDDISLTIEKGTIYGLIGPSGAGKTTLVKLIVGMDVSDTGSISVFNQSVPNFDLLQRIGYMAQADALYIDLTGKENLAFFASLYGMSKEEQRKRMDYTAELVGLTDQLSKKVNAYSGGMKRRLSLAIALIQDPDILILDEPTVGMDPALRLSIWNELLRLKNEEGKTILVTTHVMDEAERCDVLAMVREGRILANGSPTELKKSYNASTLDEVFLHAGREQV